MATKWQLEEEISRLKTQLQRHKDASNLFQEELDKEFSEERLEKVHQRCVKRIEEGDYAKFY